ncbi:MAG: hypothetical protein AAF617_13610, partial [Bacteroidota bacterium]
FKDNKIISKKLNRIIEKNDDVYKSYYYKDNQLIEEVTYSLYGDELLRINFEDNTRLSYEYIYDTHGNWTSQTFLENGIKKEKIIRQLEYYSE